MQTLDGVEVLDVREAAAYVGRTPETIRRWVWAGRLTARRVGNRLLLARQDLDSLVPGPGTQPLTLAQWADLLPDGSSTATSSADLVLEDRRDRQDPHAGR